MNQISICSSQLQGLNLSPQLSMLADSEGISIWVLGVLVTLKALGNETGGTYASFENLILPGLGPPFHMHTNEEESWYLLHGELVWTVGGKEFLAKQGSFIHLPRLVPHKFVNKSQKPARMLVTYAPAGNENWFLEVGKPALDLYGTPPEITREDITKANEAMKKYGVISTGPTSERCVAEIS